MLLAGLYQNIWRILLAPLLNALTLGRSLVADFQATHFKVTSTNCDACQKIWTQSQFVLTRMPYFQPTWKGSSASCLRVARKSPASDEVVRMNFELPGSRLGVARKSPGSRGGKSRFKSPASCLQVGHQNAP